MTHIVEAVADAIRAAQHTLTSAGHKDFHINIELPMEKWYEFYSEARHVGGWVTERDSRRNQPRMQFRGATVEGVHSRPRYDLGRYY